jgi:hypothetical protein
VTLQASDVTEVDVDVEESSALSTFRDEGIALEGGSSC